MKSIPSLSAGLRVRGTHIFGNKYSGTISSVRCHTIDPERMVVFINFDTPTDLGVSPSVKTGDVRTSICTEVYSPKFAGDKTWQSGTGDSFEIVSLGF